MITQWIATNLEMICVSAVAIPMAAGFGMGMFYIIDDKCSTFKWYLWLMYNDAEKDDAFAQNFFGKAFLGLGIANLIVPCLAVYSYIYFFNITLSQFVKGQTGG